MKRTLSVGLFLLSIALVAGSAKAQEYTLYERLGGGDAVEAVVGQFVDYNNADKMIAHRWKSSDVAGLKEYLTELICQATGGPCVYTGKALDVAHAGLKITEAEFNKVAANLGRALDKFNVQPKEKGELLAIVGSLKGKVVNQ